MAKWLQVTAGGCDEEANVLYGVSIRGGNSQGADGYWGSGLIDEVMIFDHALSETEVKQVYDAKK